MIYTYDVPRVSKIRMGFHCKTHSYDFQHHLNTKDAKEDKIEYFNDGVWLLQAGILNS